MNTTRRLGVLAGHLQSRSLSAQATAGQQSVRVVRQGPVTTVIIDRPEARNAVDGPTAAQLAQAFRDFDADENAKVAVLWGDGGTFCAGADLKAIGSTKMNKINQDVGDGPMGPSRMLLSKPVIAAISGHAVAGGLELACWCDMRVMEEDAVMGVFCRRWGVPLIDGGTARLPALIGLSRAMDLILTGRPISASEALNFGLANRVVPKGRARQEAETLALQIAGFPPICMRADRMSAITGVGLTQEAAIRAEFQRGVHALGEAVQGAQRFADGAGRHGKFEKPGETTE